MESCLLSENDIRTLGIVLDPHEPGFRATTYDLRVAEIIPANVRSAAEEQLVNYPLQPGGMVRVISRESLRLPDSITAHVLLKNELCRKGILAINIGVVDPGFEGPLSSTLINFGKETFFVKADDSFLRVSFIRCEPSASAQTSVKWERAAYVAQVREEVKAYAGPTFLDLEHTASRVGDQMYERFRNSLLVWAAVGAVAFAIFAIVVPLGASYTDRWISGRDKQEAEARQQMEQRLQNRLETLEKELSSSRTTSTPAVAPPAKDRH